uniref:Alpha-2-macroglobulin domain-containing protein n=1 Tax=Anopheles farauti TaxID=69004 RepID=A0A182QFG3_9DIPT
MRGRAGSFVGLAAYDKGLWEISKDHDIIWEDIEEAFGRFYASTAAGPDASFGSTGLFVRPDVYRGLRARSTRVDRSRPDHRMIGGVSERPNFQETWLWQHVTIDRTGTYIVQEYAPETITSWCLTGFSIDPKYGLGILRMTIQTARPPALYILDRLPHSIRRGETNELLFTVFSPLANETTVYVSLYTMANETEFVGTPESGECSMYHEVYG